MKRSGFKTATAAAAIILFSVNAYAAVSILSAAKEAEKYAESSIEYQISKLSSESAVLGAYSDSSAVKTLEGNIQSYENTLSSLKDSLIGTDSDEYEETADRIYQTQLALFNAKRQLAVYKNKVRENEFYEEYSEKELSVKKLETAGGIYSQLLDIEQSKAYMTFYSKLTAELETSLRIENSKVELGYSMQSEADKIAAQLSSSKAEYEYYRRSADETQSYLTEICGADNSENYDFSFEPQSEKTYRSKFAETDYLSEYKQKQAESIEKYIAELKALSDEIELYVRSDSGCRIKEALNDLSDEISYDITIAENNAEQAELDLKLYEIRREHYIQQLIDKAEIGRMRLKAKDDEIIAAEEELRVDQILLESGRIKEVDLMHTETELSKLKAERKSEEVNMNKIYFYLENGLYLVNDY